MRNPYIIAKYIKRELPTELKGHIEDILSDFFKAPEVIFQLLQLFINDNISNPPKEEWEWNVVSLLTAKPMNELIKNGIDIEHCKHYWIFTNYGWCQECSEFYEAKKAKLGWDIHGAIVSQCIRCGAMYDPEWGFFHVDEIENFKFNETKIPHIVEVRGVLD